MHSTRDEKQSSETITSGLRRWTSRICGHGHTGCVTKQGVWQYTCYCLDRDIYKIDQGHISHKKCLDECNDRFVDSLVIKYEILTYLLTDNRP